MIGVSVKSMKTSDIEGAQVFDGIERTIRKPNVGPPEGYCI